MEVDEDYNNYTYATILGPTLNSADVVQPIARLPQMEVCIHWLNIKQNFSLLVGVDLFSKLVISYGRNFIEKVV